MPKVTVTAKEDFFDRGNQRPRKKGEEFVLRAETAKFYEKQVTVKKGSEGPKDMTMDSIKQEDTAAPAKVKAPVKAVKPAKKSKK